MIKSVLSSPRIKKDITEIRKKFGISDFDQAAETKNKKLWHNIGFLNATEALFVATQVWQFPDYFDEKYNLTEVELSAFFL